MGPHDIPRGQQVKDHLRGRGVHSSGLGYQPVEQEAQEGRKVREGHGLLRGVLSYSSVVKRLTRVCEGLGWIPDTEGSGEMEFRLGSGFL